MALRVKRWGGCNELMSGTICLSDWTNHVDARQRRRSRGVADRKHETKMWRIIYGRIRVL